MKKKYGIKDVDTLFDIQEEANSGEFTFIDRIEIEDTRPEFPAHESLIFKMQKDEIEHCLIIFLDSAGLARDRSKAFPVDDTITTQAENISESYYIGSTLKFVNLASAKLVAEEAVRLAKAAKIDLSVTDEDRLSAEKTILAQAKRIRQEARAASLHENIAELLYILTADLIKTEKSANAQNCIMIREDGELHTDSFPDYATEGHYPGAELDD